MEKNTKDKRSQIMRNIHSKDTKPEIFLRKELWHSGIRYRKNFSDIPGTPDIFISRYKTAIFVNGCFWHQHQDHNCPFSHIPKSNSEYWESKFIRNKRRDLQNKTLLISSSIQVIIIWECTIGKMMKSSEYKYEIINKIIEAIKNGCDLYYEF